MSECQEIMDKLSKWEFWADSNEFCKVWKDKDMCDHLWGKFRGYNHSVLRLWGNLDGNNKKILSDYLKEKEIC